MYYALDLCNNKNCSSSFNHIGGIDRQVTNLCQLSLMQKPRCNFTGM